MINYNPVTIGGGYNSLCYQNRKEERTGLIPVASPRLPKGGLRLSDESQRLSDAVGGDS